MGTWSEKNWKHQWIGGYSWTTTPQKEKFVWVCPKTASTNNKNMGFSSKMAGWEASMFLLKSDDDPLWLRVLIHHFFKQSPFEWAQWWSAACFATSLQTNSIICLCLDRSPWDPGCFHSDEHQPVSTRVSTCWVTATLEVQCHFQQWSNCRYFLVSALPKVNPGPTMVLQNDAPGYQLV